MKIKLNKSTNSIQVQFVQRMAILLIATGIGTVMMTMNGFIASTKLLEDQPTVISLVLGMFGIGIGVELFLNTFGLSLIQKDEISIDREP